MLDIPWGKTVVVVGILGVKISGLYTAAHVSLGSFFKTDVGFPNFFPAFSQTFSPTLFGVSYPFINPFYPSSTCLITTNFLNIFSY